MPNSNFMLMHCFDEMRHDEDYAFIDVVKEAARELTHTFELLLLRKDRDNQRGLAEEK